MGLRKVENKISYAKNMTTYNISTSSIFLSCSSSKGLRVLLFSQQPCDIGKAGKERLAQSHPESFLAEWGFEPTSSYSYSYSNTLTVTPHWLTCARQHPWNVSRSTQLPLFVGYREMGKMKPRCSLLKDADRCHSGAKPPTF